MCERSTISKMVIGYSLPNLLVNPSSLSSVKLVIICGNLEERELKLELVFRYHVKILFFFSFKPISE